MGNHQTWCYNMVFDIVQPRDVLDFFRDKNHGYTESVKHTKQQQSNGSMADRIHRGTTLCKIIIMALRWEQIYDTEGCMWLHLVEIQV